MHNFPVTPVSSSHYSIRISTRARRLQLRINQLGDVEVILPHKMSRRHVEPFVNEHLDWIQINRSRITSQYLDKPPSMGLRPDTINLAAIDKDYTLCYRKEANNRVSEISSSTPCMLLIESNDESKVVLQLQRWLTRMAKKHLSVWLEEVASELGFSYKKISIRGQKTRWGSYSSKGTLCLNRSLLLLEPDVVRYLFVHELCHSVHMNHSPRYWKLVSSIEPNYKFYEKCLNQASKNMPLWVLYNRVM